MKKTIYILSILLFLAINIHAEEPAQKKAYDPQAERSRINELEVFLDKCSLCHTIERVYARGALKPWEWERIVNWMKNKVDGVMSDDEAKLIANYLSTDKYLVEYRCTECHSMERINKKEIDNTKEWIAIITAMHERKKEWIKKDEIERIAWYLGSKKRRERRILMQNIFSDLVFLENNIKDVDLTKLVHKAENLAICIDDLCQLPPLKNSDEFVDFAKKLSALVKDLKKNLNVKDVKETSASLGKIRMICGECHGVLRK